MSDRLEGGGESAGEDEVTPPWRPFGVFDLPFGVFDSVGVVDLSYGVVLGPSLSSRRGLRSNETWHLQTTLTVL